MNGYKNSQELYDAGYAVQQYDISTVKRTWRYKDKTFTTPYDIPVEVVMWNNFPMQVLSKEQIDGWLEREVCVIDASLGRGRQD